MELICNKEQYWDFIRELRNMDGVKQGFINQDYITVEEHALFMKKYSNCFYICLVDNSPAGYVGVIKDDIRVATHPDFQGQGVGKYMINELMNIHKDAVAKVKISNKASLNLFQACGFEKKYYILEKTNAS